MHIANLQQSSDNGHHGNSHMYNVHDLSTLYTCIYPLCMYLPSMYVSTLYACIYPLCMYLPSMHVSTLYACIYPLCMYLPSMHVSTLYACIYPLCMYLPSMYVYMYLSASLSISTFSHLMCIPSSMPWSSGVHAAFIHVHVRQHDQGKIRSTYPPV